MSQAPACGIKNWRSLNLAGLNFSDKFYFSSLNFKYKFFTVIFPMPLNVLSVKFTFWQSIFFADMVSFISSKPSLFTVIVRFSFYSAVFVFLDKLYFTNYMNMVN